jgi:predicted transcriptional regulator
MVDLDSFLTRTNRTKAGLLRELGMDPKSSLLSSYEKGRSNPSFEVVEKLIMLGMTPLEIFGKEIDDKIRSYYKDVEKSYDDSMAGIETDEELDRRVKKSLLRVLGNLDK